MHVDVPRQVALYGTDHTELGLITVESPGPGVAVAISKGKHEKQYPHVDSNEDVVAAATGPRGTLFLCADGHNGYESSDEAVRFLLDELGDDPTRSLDQDDVVELFHGAHQAVLARTTAEGCPNPDSKTTLCLAQVVGQRLTWASMGDSAVIRTSLEAGETHWVPESFFVGWHGMTRTALAARLPRGTVELMPGEWIVLATDGFTNFAWAETPDEAVRAQLSPEVTAEELARRLVEAAFEGGAGDNVAVAVCGPSR